MVRLQPRLRMVMLGPVLALLGHTRAGRNTMSTDEKYIYGGLDVTGEHLGVLPKNTGIDFSKPNQAYCDGCITTVEQFHVQWLKYVTKESQEGDEVDQKDAGSAPPAITYNDEVEDMVTDICKSKIYREDKLTDQVTEVCQSLIGQEETKRKIVAQFLAKDLSAKFLPERKAYVCQAEGGLAQACPKDNTYAFDKGGTSKCELCQAVVQDALYEVRRKKHVHGAWTQKSVFEILDNLCAFGVLRHGEERVDPIYEVCDELMDEHGKAIVTSIVDNLGDAAAVEQHVCSVLTENCAQGSEGGDQANKKGKKSKKKKKKSKKKKAKADL